MTVHFGDCRDVMRAMIDRGERVQMCVTSPPYFGLRDYGHPGQIGLEATPAEFVAAMVEALRALDRHGSGLMERAFTGFTAVTDQTNGSWYAVLGVAPDASPSEVDAAYKLKRRDAHPDKGGSNEAFARVTEAWSQYQRAVA